MASLDTVFELLSNERRRYALYYLKQENRPVSVDELAETIAEWESDSGEGDPMEHVEIELAHIHLPKATEVDFVEYNPDAGLVEVQGPPPKFNVMASVARVIEQPSEE